MTGVVERLHPGCDGVVRVADVRTSRGVRTRPVQRLHDLEVLDEVGGITVQFCLLLFMQMCLHENVSSRSEYGVNC